MKKVLFLTLALGLGMVYGQTKWSIDTDHSNIGFEISHMAISTTEGQFNDYEINLESASNADFSGSKVSATIQTNSIDTDNNKRDGHLRTEDFFSVEKFPTMTFTSTSFTKKSDTRYEIVGDMTLLGVTQSVTFEAKLTGVADDPWGNKRSGWKATSTIDRTEFGMDGSTGMVGSEVDITINAEFIMGK